MTDPIARRRLGRRAVVGGVAAAAVATAAVGGWIALRSGGTPKARSHQLALRSDPSALVATGMARLVGRRVWAGSDPISADLAVGQSVGRPVGGERVAVAMREDTVADTVVYGAWRTPAQDSALGGTAVIGRPSIRVWRGLSGTDELIADGAYGAALSPRGQLAYARGVDPDMRKATPYLATIVVRLLNNPTSTLWTSTPARYLPVAWSGNSLVAYEFTDDTSANLIAFGGPDLKTTLLERGVFVAVSPDGKQVAVTNGSSGIWLVDVATGDIAKFLTLPPTVEAQVGRLRPAGSWRDTRIAIAGTKGLLELDTASALSVAAIHPYSPDLPDGIVQPQYVDDTTVIGTAEFPSSERGASAEHALVVCALAAGVCSAGERSGTSASWRRWVVNWSR